MTPAIRQILSNTVSGWFAIAVRMAIAVAMVPFLLSRMGKEGYGLIGLLGVLLSMSGVADLGLRSALGRELAEKVARKDMHGFNELASTAFLLYLIIALVLASAGFVLAPWFATVFKVSAELRHESIWMVRVYGTLSVILSFVSPVFSAALSSRNRFDLVNAIGTAGGIVSSVLLFALVPLAHNPMRVWVWTMLATQTTVLALKVRWAQRLEGGMALRADLLSPSQLPALFRLGGSMYLLQMTQALSERSDPLVISAFYGPTGVALYQPGSRLSQLIRPIVLVLANQMCPLTTRHHVLQQVQKLQTVLVYGTKYTLLIGSLFAAGMLVFARPFARLWLEPTLGEDYHMATNVMLGWALADLTIYAAGTQSAVLVGMKKLRFLMWTQLPTAILNVLASVYLVGYTRLGIPGVLAATILIGIVRRPVLVWHTARACGLRPIDYVIKAYLPSLLVFTLSLAGAWATSRLVPPTTYSTLAFCAAVTGVIWLAACWLIGLQPNERRLVRATFAQSAAR